MSSGENSCKVERSPDGLSTECGPTLGSTDDATVLVKATSDDEANVRVPTEDDRDGVMTAGSTFFVGVIMRPGQRAEDQEFKLRVSEVVAWA